MAAMDVQVRIRAIDQFSKTLDKLQKKLNSLDGARGGVKSGDAVGAAYVRHVDRVGKNVAAATQARSTAATGAGMPAVGLPAGLLGGAAIGVGMQRTVAAAADFESALTEIQKKAGTTTAQTAALGEEIKALATSGELAVPISEIAAAYERGAAAGIPIRELREFAAQSVKAADAFGMSAESVGNFAAKLKSGMGMTNDQVKRVFDLTNSLADAGIADESALVDYMGRVGASLKVAGMSAEKSLALGATFLNLGFQAEVASTATGALTSKMLTVGTLTGKTRKSFERVLGPVENFSDLVEKDFNGALIKLLETTAKLPAAQKAAFLKDFVGAEWADELIRLSEGVEEYRRNIELAGNESKWFGSLDQSYKLKLDDFWSQWTVMKNALDRLMIEAGTMAMPGLKAALEGAIGLIAEMSAGLKTFEARVDWTSVNEAKEAVTSLARDIADVLGLDTSESSTLTFFKQLAEAVNQVSKGIKAAKDGLEFLNDPMGLNTKEGRRKPEPETGDGWFEKYRRESVRPDSPLDRALGFLGAWMDEADRRHEAANPKRPADDLNVKPADTVRAMQTGRIRPAPYDPFAAGRVPDQPLTPPPEMDPAMLERLRQRAQGASANLGTSTGAIAIPTARPEIDATAFLQGTAEINAAKAGIAAPVMATADMNIAPLLSKVEQAKAAVRSLDAMSATVGSSGGSGNGANFNARVRDQF